MVKGDERGKKKGSRMMRGRGGLMEVRVMVS